MSTLTQQAFTQTNHLTPKISIIMPAYNVGNKIDIALKQLLKNLTPITNNYEIIIVDDGSQSPPQSSIITTNNRIKIIKHPKNLGKGAAIKTGTKYATGEYTIIMDADGDINPINLKQYIDALKQYDIIVASKRHPDSTYQAPTIRKILSITYNALAKILLGIKLGDTQTGLKAFKTQHLKTIMKVIVVKRYTWDTEALAIANMLKLKIAEAPVHIKQENLFKIKDALKMLLEILGIVYRLRIIRWYQKNIEKENPQYKLLLKI